MAGERLVGAGLPSWERPHESAGCFAGAGPAGRTCSLLLPWERESLGGCLGSDGGWGLELSCGWYMGAAMGVEREGVLVGGRRAVVVVVNVSVVIYIVGGGSRVRAFQPVRSHSCSKNIFLKVKRCTQGDKGFHRRNRITEGGWRAKSRCRLGTGRGCGEDGRDRRWWLRRRGRGFLLLGLLRLMARLSVVEGVQNLLCPAQNVRESID